MRCKTSRLSPDTIRFIPRSLPLTLTYPWSSAPESVLFSGCPEFPWALRMSANHLIYAMLTHRGRVRQGNEDTCAADPAIGAYVVCDGMGGAAAGELASNLAADSFLAHLAPLATSLRSDQRAAKPQARLLAAIQAANQTVLPAVPPVSRLLRMGNHSGRAPARPRHQRHRPAPHSHQPHQLTLVRSAYALARARR